MRGYRHEFLKFYQLPNSNLFTHHLLFFWEKPLVKPTAPGSLSHIICLSDIFSLAFIFRSINIKIQKTLLHISIYFIWRSIYQFTTKLFTFVCLSWGAATRKGLTAPFTRWVASSCYLCAGVVYAVLLDTSPTYL